MNPVVIQIMNRMVIRIMIQIMIQIIGFPSGDPVRDHFVVRLRKGLLTLRQNVNQGTEVPAEPQGLFSKEPGSKVDEGKKGLFL